MLAHLAPGGDGARRVVVLGKHGFVATYLARELPTQGLPVEAISRQAVDLTDPAAAVRLTGIIQETDTVVITAGLTPDKGRDFRTMMKNLRMAENLCEVFEKTRCAHVIYLSSDGVYDAHKTPLDEDSSREPVDLYAVMHTGREMMLGSVLAARGIPYCVLRPVNIYGFGDTHNSYGPNRFIRQAFKERKITVFGKGEERRNHLYIADAVRLIALCVRNRSTGTLNLLAPGTVSFMRLAELVRSACPFEVEFEFKPRTVPTIHRPYKITQVFRFVYNLGRPVGPIVHRPYVVTQLRHAFPGFHFTQLADAIRECVRLYQDSLSPQASAVRAERSGARL